MVEEGISSPPLPEEETPSGSNRSLASALVSNSRSTVKAKIVKISPVKFKCDGTLPVRCLGLKDTSGYAKVALFANMAEQSYKEDSTVEVSGVYKKVHNNKPQLVVSRDSAIQFLPEDSNINVEESDRTFFLTDGDFCVPDADEDQTYEVDSILGVTTYTGCTTSGCHMKKLQHGVCPTCQGHEGKLTCYGKLSIVDNGTSTPITLFQADLYKLFGNFNLSQPETSIIMNMVEKLPISFKAKQQGRNMYNIRLL